MLGLGWGGDFAVAGWSILDHVIGKGVSLKTKCNIVKRKPWQQRLDWHTGVLPTRRSRPTSSLFGRPLAPFHYLSSDPTDQKER